MARSQVETLESRRLFAADISISLASSTLAANLVAGDDLKPTPKASFSVSANGGTFTKTEAKAKLTLTVALRPASGSDVVLGTAQVPASSIAKKAKTVNFSFSKFKVAPAAGTYTFVASLSNTAAVGDTNTANDSVSSAVTVTAPVSPFGSTLGNKITFKTTASVKVPAVAGFRSQTQETGTWTDNAGHSGTFKYTTGGNDSADGLMVLTGGAMAGMKFANLKAGKDAPKIGKATYVFGGSSAGFATVVYAGQTINVSKGK